MAQWDDYIDHLIDIMDEQIPLHQVTILTGRNGSGKSMIRKLLPQFLREKEELKGQKWGISSTSMDDRARVDPNRMMVFSRYSNECLILNSSGYSNKLKKNKQKK